MKNRRARCTFIFLCLLLSLVFVHEVAMGAMTYGVGTRGSCGVYEVDFGAGTASLLFATPDIGWYGATDGDPRHPDTFYATPWGGSLYRVDVVGNTVTAVGSYGETTITGLAYDEVHDILYATDYKNLYTVDITPGSPTEGTATLIGAFMACGDAWAFDYDASIDKLVALAHTKIGTKTYHIDRTTGLAEYVGYSCTKRITDVWYDPDSQKMFGVGNDLLTGRGKLYEINSSTGQIVKTACIRHDLLGLGGPNPIPEPATVVLLGLGGLALVRKRRAKTK
jgi:hypothetical protein